MHKQLRNALEEAEGFSDLVVVIFLDVRGFSSFAGMAESSEAAVFLRRMYLSILDDYFPDSVFFKPTGDGLMIIKHFDRNTIETEVTNAIQTSLELIKDFPTISANDPMVNFDVPSSLGVGIARGAATRLASGDLTLDYSGRPLNLAARLMDLARPHGVVFDRRLVKGLDIDDSLLSNFEGSDVYIKGIADKDPMHVYASSDVSVPARNRRPLEGVPYESRVMTIPFKEFASRGRFIHRPPVEPLDPDQIEMRVLTPKPTKSGSKSANLVTVQTMKPVETKKTAAGWEAVFDYGPTADSLSEAGVKGTWDCRITLQYMATEQG